MRILLWPAERKANIFHCVGWGLREAKADVYTSHPFCAPPLNHTSYVSLNVLHQFHKVTALQIFQPGNNKLLNNCGNYCRIK